MLEISRLGDPIRFFADGSKLHIFNPIPRDVSASVETKSATGSISASSTEITYLCTAAGGSITLTLLESSNYSEGIPLRFVKTDTTSSTVTLNTTSSQTFNPFSATSIVLRKPGESVEVIPKSAGFEITGSNNHKNKLPQNYKTGMTVSYNSTTDIDIATGSCRSDDDTYDIVLTSALTKLGTASFTAGSSQGGLDTGSSLSANTWYHIYAIANPVTDASDVVMTSTYGNPSLPSGYTKKKRIASRKTNGSSQFIQWIAHDDLVYYATVGSPATISGSGTGENTITLDVPTGIRTYAYYNIVGDTAGVNIYLYPTDVSNQSPTTTGSPLSSHGDGAGAVRDSGSVLTDTSGQVHVDSSADQDIEVAVTHYRDFFID